MINVLLEQAEAICNEVGRTRGNIHRDVGAALNQLRDDALELATPDQREWFARRLPVLETGGSAPYPILPENARLACTHLLSLLRSIKRTAQGVDGVPRLLPETKRVFIVHGRDGENALRLHRLIRDRWKLEPVVLADQASRGRSIIEKFEDEAGDCAFAIVLLTPDDVVNDATEGYRQARPNVLFELGWFYGRLGRERVCIAYKRGTNIPSDLAGIGRVEFNEQVEECALTLETELLAAQMLLNK